MSMRVKDAKEIVGGLSQPSKMPCHGYSIPATKCLTGAKLRKIVNSICSKCYALKGRYMFGAVQAALMNRYNALYNPLWVFAMAFLINRYESGRHFRWHDSGDIQNLRHLKMIVAVCHATPTVSHWLPTREYAFVREYVETLGAFPPNLTVRLSAFMFDGPAPTGLANRLGLTTSGASKQDFSCPAYSNDGMCGDCRACWNPKVKNVNYKKH